VRPDPAEQEAASRKFEALSAKANKPSTLPPLLATKLRTMAGHPETHLAAAFRLVSRHHQGGHGLRRQFERAAEHHCARAPYALRRDGIFVLTQ
jgi:hypothetical protein